MIWLMVANFGCCKMVEDAAVGISRFIAKQIRSW